jgi:exonuclease SbcD
MKISFVGDVHLGSGYHLGFEDANKKLNSRLLDFNNTLNYILDTSIQEKVEYLCFAGDLFRDNRPTNEQLNFFCHAIKKLVLHNIGVVIVIGNHDQTMKLSSYHVASFFSTLGVNNVLVGDKISPIKLLDKSGNLGAVLISMPYRNPQMLGLLDANTALKQIQAKFNSVLSLVKKEYEQIPTIVLAHYLVEGVSKFGVEIPNHEKEITLPISMFGEVDHTFVGHVHNSQTISKNPSIYVLGSIDRVDYGESNDNKSFCIFDTKTKSYKIMPLPVRPLYHIEFFPSSKEELEKHISSLQLDGAIVKLTLTVEPEILEYLTEDYIRDLLIKKNIHYCSGIHFIKAKKEQIELKETLDFDEVIEILSANIENDSIKQEVVSYAKEIARKLYVAL